MNRALDRKKILIIAFILLIVFIFVIFIFIQIQKKQKQQIYPTTELSQTKINNLKIAKKALNWLDKQKDQNGIYYYALVCSEKNDECKITPGDKKSTGPIIIWGRFQYYKATKNEEDLKAFNNDLDIYTDKNKVKIIQNHFWNCKLMYELWQDDLLNPQQKEKIKQICKNSTYDIDIKKIDESKDIPSFDLKKIIENKQINTSPYIVSDISENLNKYSVYASDFLYRFLWENNEIDLKRAKWLFYQAINLYQNEKRDVYIGGKCVLGISALDMYKVTDDNSYLEFAKSFFEKENIKNNCSEPTLEINQSISRSACVNFIYEKVTCAIFANELYKATNNIEYKNFYEKLLNKIITENFNQEDGFFGAAQELKYRPLTENALLIGILSKNEN